MGQFQVLFSGEIVEGATVAVVRRNLARALTVDDRKLEQLFSGRTVVLRSQLDQHEAEALQARMSDLGAVMRIKDTTPQEKASLFFDSDDKDNEVADYTLHDLTAAHITCPRCGHLQLDAEFCARCGIDIRATLKQQRKQDLLIEKKIRELRAKQTPAAPKRGTTAVEPDDPMPDDAIRTENRNTDQRGRRGLKRFFKKK